MNTRVCYAALVASATLLLPFAALAEPGPAAASNSAEIPAVPPSTAPPAANPPAAASGEVAAPVATAPVATSEPPAAATNPALAAPESAPAPSFGASDGFGPAPEQSALGLKMYGDTQFQVRNHAPVHNTFAAPHLDLFGTADVDRLSFLTEVFFEARDNEISTDVERLQVSYLFSNWLRLRMGRTHTALGYYNDTYHHGNLFELSTSRPFAAQFEDGGGLFVAHLVGVGADGSLDLGSAGQLHYDLEAGNGRLADTTAVAIEEAGKDAKLVNLRLRWLPIDGLTIGANLLHDQIPVQVDAMGLTTRPKISELVGGAHVVYMDQGVHALLETYLVRHAASGGASASTYGGFLELGYAIGQFTPYLRPELIHFPKSGDLVYQADGAAYTGVRDLVDYRLGVNWLPMPQLSLKLEAQRLQHDSHHQELATFKVAFGF
jgi:hypothetical protein